MFILSVSMGYKKIKRFLCVAALTFTALSANAQALQQLNGHLLPRETTANWASPLDSAQPLHITIGLPLKNQEALNGLLKATYDPNDSHYRHFLTPEQFGQMFGASEVDYQTLLDFAQRHHLQVTSTFKNHLNLSVTGTAAQIGEAFHLHLNNYLRKDGTVFYAPDQEPSMDINIPIQHISGLDNYGQTAHKNKNGSRPLGSASSFPNNAGESKGKSLVGNGPNCFGTKSYTAGDLRTALLPCNSLDGTGQTVALVEFDNYYDADISGYAAQSGQSVPAITRVPVDEGIAQAPGCNNLECSIDIEMVMALAPKASILVYEGPYNGSCWTNITPLDVLTQIANDDLASVISSSWSWYGYADTNVTNIFNQFALQGQTYFQSSGDDGAYYSGDPDSVPWQPIYETQLMTVVGGTQLTTSGAPGTYVSETTWNSSPGPAATQTPAVNAVSGGGFCDNSSPLAIPTYQVPFVNGTNSASPLYRNIPDVAMIGYNLSAVWDNGTYGCCYGTSAAAPLWAALLALSNEEAVSLGKPTLGYINPTLYNMASKPATYAADFNDIQDGSNNNYWGTNTNIYKAVAGYDLCTGLGSPKCSMINDILQIPPTATPTYTNTITNTPTLTCTNTITNTPTITPTPTNTPTITDTPTITNTPLFTYTSTFTASPTNTFTPTITLTPTNTSIYTNTSTPTPPWNGKLVIYPNPVSVGNTSITLPITKASNVTIKIFTLGLRKMQEESYSNVLPGVSFQLQLVDKQGVELANGLYYVVVDVASQRYVSKLLIIR